MIGRSAPEPRDTVGQRHSRLVGRGDADWLGLGEASRLLGISQGTLRRWADEGRVAVFVTPGGHRRFSRQGLRRLLPTAAPSRPSLSRLGASPERLLRAYRPSTRTARAGQPQIGWVDRLPDGARDGFRERGRAIVTGLLEHLDGADAATRAAGLDAACRLAEEHGARTAALGASLPDAVETFLRFRSPFVAELAEIARRRGVGTRQATDLLAAADEAMDRLLVAMMSGHSPAPAGEAVEERPDSVAPAATTAGAR